MVTLTESDDGRILPLAVGATIEVRLAENATTGYSWTIDQLDAAILVPSRQESDYRAAAIGSGGTAVFRAIVRSAGTSRLTLKLLRPWEGDSAIIKRFGITVVARR